MAKKLYLLDTNVLLYDPTALDNFQGVTIGIPGVVLEELDTFKREGTDRGRNARQVIRMLDGLRSEGSLQDGVKLKNGSTVKVVFAPATKTPAIPFRLHIDDNEILLTAYALTKQYDVKFISKDLNARVKADALGITAEDYIHETITEEEFYRGWVRVSVPSIQLKQDVPKYLEEFAHEHKFAPNEFALVESNNNPQNYRLFRYGTNKKFMSVQEPRLKWPLYARNPQQAMALNLLLDPAVKLVNLFGTAGTGKTFLALLAGLHQVLIEERYEKMLVARPVVPLGRDIGYLPGTMQEKLYSWMLPVYDNMEFIVHAAGAAAGIKSERDQRDQEVRFNKKHKHKGKHGKDKYSGSHEGRILTLDDMMRWGKVSLEAITYMRGRSIPYQYILIDEAQNLTPHEVKTLVSRVGEDSKIILAGDPYQIDTPYLDFSSNGLVVTGERMKGQSLFGAVFLEHSERSELSQLAAELL
ncbi:MAG: PhoH family protein [Candidatus Babeliales bacterium]